MVAASEDMEPSNGSGEGDKNVDYATRMKQFLGAADLARRQYMLTV